MTENQPPRAGFETKTVPGYVPAPVADNHENEKPPGYSNTAPSSADSASETSAATVDEPATRAEGASRAAPVTEDR